ncbi:tyrosine-protein phosphatase non-receptor type 23 [Drosophila pseudoobscura]|uniref:Tyrosine-protein phosphatase non-receptor type 23 n=1 Tax=Drosophila pseudoobscura pseudoobscura TaxID=46245 RepID=A0A6I8W6C6_DROPS|nr:tyrosine-protein phosphatase non-receptor type 23 [Drosophila pseudoobscura]
MEAVPRLHMLWFALKSSPEGTSFAPLKKYIAEFYHEDPEAYSKEVHALETLRNQAMRTTNDGAPVMKRYYCQLHALQNRFPQLADKGIFTFTWKDLHHNTVHEVTDIRYERAAVLFNIAASHTQSGASAMRGDVDGMKMACTDFQAAAWAYNELRERYANVNNGGDFMTTELLVYQQQVCLAQAQECILEKSLIDNRKPHIVAKVTAQIVVYYGAALAALLTGGDDGPVAQVINASVYKLWKKYVRFKINYLNCILYLYQGQNAEEKRQMGERVTLYQASWDKLEEARKESKGLPDQTEINESLSFTADVVEAKRKNAKNENEFIYHEAVPELSTIAAVQGANLVNGIGFQVTDEEYAGADIFARLVPMKAHEASSMYSEEKAKLLRKYGALLEEKDAQLESYMSSLTLDNLNINEEQANKLPQGIVDRCAALHANKTAISDLIEAMSQLAEITTDVETNLGELTHMLEEEARAEREFQAASGVQRTPNAHITELTREFQKYSEAHARAGESNNTLRKAMSLHVNNLKILARPLQEIQQLMPKLSSELNTAEIFKDVKLVLNKVNEMKAQRAQFHADLRIAINEDDITGKVIAHGGGRQEGLQALFVAEMAKHERITQLLDQNLLAQQNILQALTENYAKAAPVLKTLQDVKQKREHFYSSLAASYDVYEDLLAKSAKGLEFYKKLAGNIQKLLSRFKSARDVQSEERQQRMQSVRAAVTPSKPAAEVPPAVNGGGGAGGGVGVGVGTPKLRDYLKAKGATAASIASGMVLTPDATIATPAAAAAASSYVHTVRPVPVGSENPTQAACSAYATAPPNEPPPPYSLQQQQYYDPSAAGYTNPMYQQQQQNIAPPAYKAQPSPNSQTLHGAMGQLNLQQSQDGSQVGSVSGSTYNYNYNPNGAVPLQPPLPYAAPAASNAQGFNYQQPLYVATSSSSNPGEIPASLQAPYVVNPAPSAGYQTGGGGYPHPASMYPPQSSEAYHQPSAGYPSAQQPQQAMNYASPHQSTGYPTSQTPQQQLAGYAQSQSQSQSQTLQHQPTAGYPHSQTPQQQQPPGYHQSQAPQPTTGYPHAQTPQQQQPQPPGYPQSQSQSQTPQQSMVYSQQPSGYLAQQQPAMGYGPQQPSLYPSQAVQASPQSTAGHQSSPAPSVPASQQYPQQYGDLQATVYPANGAAAAPAPAAATASNPPVASSPAQAPTPAPTPAPAPAATPAPTYISYSNHPGYSYNPQTGAYEYSSGYQQENISKPQGSLNYQFSQSGKQQAAVVGTTDSESANRSNPATGFDSPIVSHTKAGAGTGTATGPDRATAANEAAPQQPGGGADTSNYYTPPYGHHSMSEHIGGVPESQQQQPQQQQQPTPKPTPRPSGSIYMQSGATSIANTQTTTSSAPYASSAAAKDAAAAAAATSAAAVAVPVAPSNVDLLSDLDIDCSVAVPPPMLPQPLLQPQLVAGGTPPGSQVSAPIKTESTKEPVAPPETSPETSPPTVSVAATATAPAPAPAADSSPVAPPARTTSLDNLSNCSDLSSLDNFDWDSVSLTHSVSSEKQPKPRPAANGHPNNFAFQSERFTDEKTTKYFQKEVESYEKLLENLHVKMLNGKTQLGAKWHELQQMLDKESASGKRSTTIAKLFPEKNRSLDCLPFDHARVKLDKQTDDYINAAYMKNLSARCPNFIIAQTPQANTINDFWSMIWSEKSRTVVCLHTTNELFDPFWPQALDQPTHYDDYTVTCVKLQQLSHCSEFQLRLSMHGADPVLELSLLQLKQWTKGSCAQLLGIAENSLDTHRQRCQAASAPSSPLIMSCLTGSERSEMVVIGVCALIATQSKQPTLINVVDVWSRICAQRQNSLRDSAILEQAMQIVLCNAHNVLNQRGIMTSYQMKMAPQVNAKEQQETKDPLNELDALWKLK